MANRPVFVVSPDNRYCIRENIEFQYFSGFSDKQMQRSINSLHQSYIQKHPNHKLLEISTKSENELGVKLSAFNLMIKTNNGKEYSIETAFQSSKVFENGGPYTDLLNVSSREAKKDARLKNSGKIIAFRIKNRTFSIEPKTYFYNWLYINTLHHLHHDLATQILEYNAFTDIAFNPQKSINCQAEAAAIYVSLYQQDLLKEALKNEQAFLDIVYPTYKH